MSIKDVYCPIPWMFQAVRNNGDVRICCQANVTKNQGVVRKEDGSSYNAGKDNMDEARNAKLMKIVRKNMLEGKWLSITSFKFDWTKENKNRSSN